MLQKAIRIVGLTWIIAAGAVTVAAAAPITLRDGAARVVIDPASQDGLKEWRLGAQHAVKQWWWYRVGDTGPEASIDTLELEATITSDTDGDGQIDTLVVRWRHAGDLFGLEASWKLTGSFSAGMLESTLAHQIQVTSLLSTPQDITLFQYVDMDLGGGSEDTFALIDCGDAGIGDCQIGTLILQADAGDLGPTGDTGTTHETSVVSRAFNVNDFSEFPAGFAPFPDLLDDLNDASPTDLDGGDLEPSPGEGNHTWAASWTWSYPGDHKTFSLAQSQKLGSQGLVLEAPFLGELVPYLDGLVQGGLLFGVGDGAAAAARLRLMRRLLEKADGDPNATRKRTCRFLEKADRRSDGLSKPPDLVEGPALQQFNADLRFVSQAACFDGKLGDPVKPPPGQ